MDMRHKRSETANKLLYMALNSLLFIVAFVIVYKLYLQYIPNDWEFIYYILPYNKKLTLIFLFNFGLGIIISFILRIAIGYWDEKFHAMNFIFRNLIQSLLYSILIWIGVIAFFFDYMEWLDLVITLLAIKLFVFLIGDFFADKLSFGG